MARLTPAVPADDAAALPPPIAAGIVVRLGAMFDGVRKQLTAANTGAGAAVAEWPERLTELGWRAPTFVIDSLELAVPCLLRGGKGMRAAIELVGDAAAGAPDRYRLVMRLAWSAETIRWACEVRLERTAPDANKEVQA